MSRKSCQVAKNKRRNPYKETPLDDIAYNTVLDVIDSWEMVTAMPNWKPTVGETFLTK